MSTHIINTNEEDILDNDRFIAVEKDCEGNVFLKKSSSAGSPCPGADNFLLSQGQKSGLIPSGCYDGTEIVTIQDTNLVPSNIKIGVTIFETQGTDPGPQYTIGNNITLGNGLLTGLVPQGLYLSKTLSLFDSDLVSSNIKDGSSVLGVSGNRRGEEFDTPVVLKSYHMGYTHSNVDVNDEDTVATQVGVIQYQNYMYFCYSSYSPLCPSCTGNAVRREVFVTIIKYDGNDFTTILNTNYSSATEAFFRVKDSTTFSIHITSPMVAGGNIFYDVNMSSGVVTTGTDTSGNTLIATNITVGVKKYYPILTQTSLQGSRSGTKKGQSLNLKITR